jgi:hypothetical protein
MKLGGAVLLAACTLVQGCAGGSIERLRQHCDFVQVGATREDVLRDLGPPAKVHHLMPDPGGADQTVEVWSYTFTISRGPGVGAVIVCIVLVVLLIFLLAAAGGRSFGGSGPGGPGGGGEVWRFCIGFGTDGRVRGVSVLEPIH